MHCQVSWSGGESSDMRFGLIAAHLGGGTALALTETQVWIDLMVSKRPADDRADWADTSLVFSRHAYCETQRSGAFSQGVAHGRLQCFLTGEWIADLLRDRRRPVAHLRLLIVDFEWSATRLDTLVVKKLELGEIIEPLAGGVPARLREAEVCDVDWEAAFAPRKRQRRGADGVGASSALASPPAPLCHAVDDGVGEFDGDVVVEATVDSDGADMEQHQFHAVSELRVALGMPESEDSDEDTDEDEYGDVAHSGGGAGSGNGAAPAAAADRPARAPPQTLDMPWQKRPVLDATGHFVGWLVWDEVHSQIDAHCGRHRGTATSKCHVHRVLKKRPMGYLCAWLFNAHHHNGREGHFDARLRRRDDEPCGLPQRRAAREVAQGQADLQFFFDLESRHPPRPGDGDEPARL